MFFVLHIHRLYNLCVHLDFFSFSLKQLYLEAKSHNNYHSMTLNHRPARYFSLGQLHIKFVHPTSKGLLAN